jgi:hypothetical protein
MRTTYNWLTTHDTANRVMTHRFGLGFIVSVNWGTKEIKTFRNADVISTQNYDETKLLFSDYEKMLLKIEQEVEQLKAFDNGHD